MRSEVWLPAKISIGSAKIFWLSCRESNFGRHVHFFKIHERNGGQIENVRMMKH